MTREENFIIQFANLQVGKHEFSFKIKDAFFNRFEHSEIRKGNFDVLVRLQKQTAMLILDFEIKGKAFVDCDRCGEEFGLTVKGQQNLIVKLDGSDLGDSDEMVSLPVSSNEIDIAQYIYECIILALPLKRTHPGKTGKNACNPETLRKLDEILIKTEVKATDPRWDALKNIHLS